MRPSVDITWVDPHNITVQVDARTVHVSGEGLLESADLRIYATYPMHWDDGTRLTDEEKADVLDDVVEEAARRGWRIELTW